MKVTLLRHSQTRDNLLGRYLGHGDLPLCDQGQDLARQVPPRLDVARVHTSTLVRTVETARILYPRAQIHRHPRLMEINFGDFEGKTWRDLEQDPRYRHWVDHLCEPPCPGGEAKADFTRRCVRAFGEILEEEAAQGAEELHLVVHGGTVMAVMSCLATPPRPYFDWSPGFCGGYLLAYQPGQSRPLALIESIRPKEGAHTP